MTIGQRLVALRGEKAREDVSKDLGISLSALGMYERDERIPRDTIKVKIANYYNSTVQDIFYTQK